MPFTKNGKFFCPGCGAEVTITTSRSGLFVANIELIINKYEEEASPEGNVRPDGLPEGTDAKAKG